MDNPDQLGPTRQDAALVRRNVEERYGATLPHAAAAKFAALAWQLAQQDATPETADEFRDLLAALQGEAPSRKEARKLQEALAQGERIRIVHEMRGIVIAHRPVPYDPATEEHLAALLRERYDVTPDPDLLAQVVTYLTRALWQSKGLDASLVDAVDHLESKKHRKQSESILETLDTLFLNRAGGQKVLVFTEGTVLMHRDALGKTREEAVRQVEEGNGSVREYASYVPIGKAPEKLRQWERSGYRISYLTSRRLPGETEEIARVLQRHGFPEGALRCRKEGQEYADVVTLLMPDIFIEDDCESVGADEIVYGHIEPVAQAKIRSVVIPEFGGIDHLPDVL